MNINIIPRARNMSIKFNVGKDTQLLYRYRCKYRIKYKLDDFLLKYISIKIHNLLYILMKIN